MVWPGLVPVRPAKACALFPPFEAEVLLLWREREGVPTSPTTGRWTAHTLRPVTLQAWPVKHRNQLPTLASTDQRSKEPDTCANTTTTSLFTVLCYSFYFSFFSPRSSHFWPQAMMSKNTVFKKSTFHNGKTGQVCWCKSVDTGIIAKFKYCPNSMWRRFRPIETHWK